MRVERVAHRFDAIVVQLETEVDPLLELRLRLVRRVNIDGLVRDHRRAVVLDARINHAITNRLCNHVLGVLLALEMQLARNVRERNA